MVEETLDSKEHLRYLKAACIPCQQLTFWASLVFFAFIAAGLLIFSFWILNFQMYPSILCSICYPPHPPLLLSALIFLAKRYILDPCIEETQSVHIASCSKEVKLQAIEIGESWKENAEKDLNGTVHSNRQDEVDRSESGPTEKRRAVATCKDQDKE